MIKFLHTSDWQMGMKARHVSEQADKVREARLKAANNVLMAAQEENSDFIIIAGDLFEDNAVDLALVQSVVDLLSKAPCPVFIIPGNHDAFIPGSVYHHSLWERASSRIHILGSAEPLEVGGAILYPCPLFEKSSRLDPTSWIPPEEPNRIRVGIAHGSLMIRDDIPDDDFPIAPDAVVRSRLDYLALGHWHSLFRYKGSDGVERTAYSGTHETTKFGESRSGHALAVEIQESEAEPRIREIFTGTLNWQQWKREVSGAADVEHLIQDLEQIESPEALLLEIVLEGTLDAGGLTLMEEELRPALESRYLYHRLNIDNLIPQPTESEMQQLIRTGPLREAADRLSRMANSEAEDMTPEVAKRALSTLYCLAREVQG